MLRFFTFAMITTALFVTPLVPVAHAAGYCPSQPGGKCPTPKKATSRKPSDFTPEQRKKLMEEALQVCKKTFGAEARVYKIDYRNWRPVCTLNTR